MSTGYGYELPDGGLWPAEVLVKEHFEKRGWRTGRGPEKDQRASWRISF